MSIKIAVPVWFVQLVLPYLVLQYHGHALTEDEIRQR